MMNPACSEVYKNQNTEVLGSMLAGLVQALGNVHVLSGESVANLVKNIESNAWYPMPIFFRLLEDLCKFEVDPEPILFQAGASFARDWYEHGDTRTVTCAADFLRMQGNNVGYSMVHRGSTEKVGRLDLAELDEGSGLAKLVCITPYPSQFERGLFQYGTYLAGDVDYVHIETAVEPYNHHLDKKTHVIRFHRKTSAEANAALGDILATLMPPSPIAIPAELQESLVWRLKALEEQREQDRRFHEQSSHLFSKAASQLCLLSSHLDKLAHRDPLTDVLNRRAILESTQNIYALAARNSSPMAFIMIDIDHFKTINDTWGHAAGDETLRSVTAVLQDNLRDSDLLGRMGGEEFLVVLPETDLEGARMVAEKLRAAIQANGAPPAYSSGQPLTISLGVVACPPAAAKNADCNAYIRRADQALYRSKKDGRNRVTTADLS